MGTIIQFPSTGFINVQQLRDNTMRLDAGLIAPAKEKVEADVLAEEHAADPIKRMEDIEAISDYCIKRKKYRNNMLFIVGINFGLRVSDLRMLRFSNLINDNLVFKDSFPVFERKTRTTRIRKVNRYITINRAVREAVTLYLENTPNVSLSDYMFQSESNHKKGDNEPMDARSINNVLYDFQTKLGLSAKCSTHTLRKTFGYHQMVMSNNDPRKLLLLQKIFGHSTAAQTLTYIGVTENEIADAYRNLNLGSKDHNYLVDSQLCESVTA